MTTTSKQLLTWGLCGIQRYAVSAMVSRKMLVGEKGRKKTPVSCISSSDKDVIQIYNPLSSS